MVYLHELGRVPCLLEGLKIGICVISVSGGLYWELPGKKHELVNFLAF